MITTARIIEMIICLILRVFAFSLAGRVDWKLAVALLLAAIAHNIEKHSPNRTIE